MKYVCFFLLIIIFSNCESTKQAQNKQPSSSFEIIVQSPYGGKETKSYEIIENQEQMNQALKNLRLEDIHTQKLNTIDFKKQAALFLHAGTYNTGGYSIEVEQIEIDKSTTYVTVKTNSPKPEEPVTMAITNPFCIALIDKNNNIQFR